MAFQPGLIHTSLFIWCSAFILWWHTNWLFGHIQSQLCTRVWYMLHWLYYHLIIYCTQSHIWIRKLPKADTSCQKSGGFVFCSSFVQIPHPLIFAIKHTFSGDTTWWVLINLNWVTILPSSQWLFVLFETVMKIFLTASQKNLMCNQDLYWKVILPFLQKYVFFQQTEKHRRLPVSNPTYSFKIFMCYII